MIVVWLSYVNDVGELEQYPIPFDCAKAQRPKLSAIRSRFE